MKKRVAVFLVGGVGMGTALSGVPSVTAVLGGLADEFRITAYSLMAPDPRFRPEGYSLFSPPRWLAGRGVQKLRWAWLASKFIAEHRREPYEVLFSFWGYPMGLYSVSLAKLVRRPSVVSILGAETASVPAIGYGYLRRPVSRRLVLATCQGASAVVVLSGQQRDTLQRYGFRGRVDVIPFGVDSEMFTPRWTHPSSPLRILHVANLTEVKDPATLIRGFALLRRDLDARLRIVGLDRMNGRVQRLAEDLGVQNDIEFVGPVAYATMPGYYQWADMFVLTSLYEAQNCSLAEAAMSGVLLVSTPVGCIPDLGEGAAVVVRTGDPADLAAKIQGIVRDPAQWQEKVALARAWAESHDVRWTVGRLCGVIERAASWR